MYIVVFSFSFYTYFKSYSKIMELENRNSLFNTKMVPIASVMTSCAALFCENDLYKLESQQSQNQNFPHDLLSNLSLSK